MAAAAVPLIRGGHNSIDVRPFIEMFGCDTARISQPLGRMFLIIGTRRNTKDDPRECGKWLKDGQPIDFEYIEERVIASGSSEAELMESAKQYKQLAEMSMAEWIVREAVG